MYASFIAMFSLKNSIQLLGSFMIRIQVFMQLDFEWTGRYIHVPQSIDPCKETCVN